MAQTKKYSKTFYRSLTPELLESIYRGAIQLASGFLSFDSASFAGTGGGAALLVGRLLTLSATYPYLLYISTKMADEVGLLELRSFSKFKKTEKYKKAVEEGKTEKEIDQLYEAWIKELFEEDVETDAFEDEELVEGGKKEDTSSNT